MTPFTQTLKDLNLTYAQQRIIKLEIMKMLNYSLKYFSEDSVAPIRERFLMFLKEVK